MSGQSDDPVLYPPELPFHLMQDLVPGEWYLFVSCEYCRTRFALAADPSKGAAPLTEKIYQATCPECKRVGFHVPKVIKRYQHPHGPVA